MKITYRIIPRNFLCKDKTGTLRVNTISGGPQKSVAVMSAIRSSISYMSRVRNF